MSRALEERIAVLAAGQHGVVTHAQLLQAGLTPWAISRRARGGRLRTLHRGVYLVGPVALPRTSEMAAVLACGPGAVLSHASAAALWALRAAEQGRVDVTVAACRRTRSGIRLHRVRRLGDEERRTV
ncbi:MAG TPA: type IV toxin-antitoxin system AbiEi family antitoxin domain-containing protein, partial [Longimicrobiales bacterium]